MSWTKWARALLEDPEVVSVYENGIEYRGAPPPPVQVANSGIGMPTKPQTRVKCPGCGAWETVVLHNTLVCAYCRVPTNQAREPVDTGWVKMARSGVY